MKSRRNFSLLLKQIEPFVDIKFRDNGILDTMTFKKPDLEGVTFKFPSEIIDPLGRSLEEIQGLFYAQILGCDFSTEVLLKKKEKIKFTQVIQFGLTSKYFFPHINGIVFDKENAKVYHVAPNGDFVEIVTPEDAYTTLLNAKEGIAKLIKIDKGGSISLHAALKKLVIQSKNATDILDVNSLSLSHKKNERITPSTNLGITVSAYDTEKPPHAMCRLDIAGLTIIVDSNSTNSCFPIRRSYRGGPLKITTQDNVLFLGIGIQEMGSCWLQSTAIIETVLNFYEKLAHIKGLSSINELNLRLQEDPTFRRAIQKEIFDFLESNKFREKTIQAVSRYTKQDLGIVFYEHYFYIETEDGILKFKTISKEKDLEDDEALKLAGEIIRLRSPKPLKIINGYSKPLSTKANLTDSFLMQDAIQMTTLSKKYNEITLKRKWAEKRKNPENHFFKIQELGNLHNETEIYLRDQGHTQQLLDEKRAIHDAERQYCTTYLNQGITNPARPGINNRYVPGINRPAIRITKVIDQTKFKHEEPEEAAVPSHRPKSTLLDADSSQATSSKKEKLPPITPQKRVPVQEAIWKRRVPVQETIWKGGRVPVQETIWKRRIVNLKRTNLPPM